MAPERQATLGSEMQAGLGGRVVVEGHHVGLPAVEEHIGLLLELMRGQRVMASGCERGHKGRTGRIGLVATVWAGRVNGVEVGAFHGIIGGP